MAEDGAVGQGGYADQAHPGCLRVLTRVEGARGVGVGAARGGPPSRSRRARMRLGGASGALGPTAGGGGGGAGAG